MKFVSAFLLALTMTTLLPAEEHAFLQNGVTAHRGNSAVNPENTLPAFKSGIAAGADWLELDIFLTKDGKLVVTHDKTTRRVGDKNLDVAESTYAELKTIDVATDFRQRKQLTKTECPPLRMPLLEEVLQLVKQQHKTRVSIQPKADCVKEAVALVKRLQMEPWAGFNDGNLNYMSQVKQLAPKIPVFWDRGAETDIEADIKIAKERGFEGLVLHFKGITPEKVQQIKAAGLEPGAWTVNDPTLMKQLLKQGVERIYTDDPRLLLQLKNQ
ncbi:Glycerophosphoryl diester phosphodiesterase [Gimesia panareensis]|uniref:Glycerophosphoryl diester phosphodiesterase n=1 Tax=Gimesia panareensis TaxID=2527978 RepID=A0A517QDF3_9PLAN|nr:glycerophosphodiester phosphodiesterase family protein [Gimesia panareensis]QDT29625.1 Glycerophosphoryl diester phosphodiesterase [Gimesia panareensis]